MHLRAARKLMRKVSFTDIMRDLGVEEDVEYSHHDDPEFWSQLMEQSGIDETSPIQVMEDARNFRELESLVKALDSLETISAYIVLAAEYDQPSQPNQPAINQSRAPAGQRDFWNSVGENMASAQENMQPLLKNWLLAGIQGKQQTRFYREHRHNCGLEKE